MIWQCGIGKHDMSTRQNFQIRKVNLTKYPSTLCRLFWLDLQRPNNLLGQVWNTKKKSDNFSIASILGGREGGRGLLVPLKRGVVVVVVFVKHGLLRASFFCGNAMQSNRVKKVKNSCMVCIKIFWIELWAWFQSLLPPFHSLFWAFPLSLDDPFVFGVKFGHLMTKEKSSASL